MSAVAPESFGDQVAVPSHLYWSSVIYAIEVQGRVDSVYDHFVDGMASWWVADGCPQEGGSTSMNFDPGIGGQLREVWQPRGGKLWGIVTAVEDALLLRLGIPNGVSWSGPGYAEFTFQPADNPEKTIVAVNHVCLSAVETDREGYLDGWRKQLETGFLTYYNSTGARQ